jgi:hypothetical protein
MCRYFQQEGLNAGYYMLRGKVGRTGGIAM